MTMSEEEWRREAETLETEDLVEVGSTPYIATVLKHGVDTAGMPTILIKYKKDDGGKKAWIGMESSIKKHTQTGQDERPRRRGRAQAAAATCTTNSAMVRRNPRRNPRRTQPARRDEAVDPPPLQDEEEPEPDQEEQAFVPPTLAEAINRKGDVALTEKLMKLFYKERIPLMFAEESEADYKKFRLSTFLSICEPKIAGPNILGPLIDGPNGKLRLTLQETNFYRIFGRVFPEFAGVLTAEQRRKWTMRERVAYAAKLSTRSIYDVRDLTKTISAIEIKTTMILMFKDQVGIEQRHKDVAIDVLEGMTEKKFKFQVAEHIWPSLLEHVDRECRVALKEWEVQAHKKDKCFERGLRFLWGHRKHKTRFRQYLFESNVDLEVFLGQNANALNDYRNARDDADDAMEQRYQAYMDDEDKYSLVQFLDPNPDQSDEESGVDTDNANQSDEEEEEESDSGDDEEDANNPSDDEGVAADEAEEEVERDGDNDSTLGDDEEDTDNAVIDRPQPAPQASNNETWMHILTFRDHFTHYGSSSDDEADDSPRRGRRVEDVVDPMEDDEDDATEEVVAQAEGLDLKVAEPSVDTDDDDDEETERLSASATRSSRKRLQEAIPPGLGREKKRRKRSAAEDDLGVVAHSHDDDTTVEEVVETQVPPPPLRIDNVPAPREDEVSPASEDSGGDRIFPQVLGGGAGIPPPPLRIDNGGAPQVHLGAEEEDGVEEDDRIHGHHILSFFLAF